MIANCPLHSKIVLIRAINDHTSFGWGELTMMCMKKIYRWTMAIKFANNSFIRQLNSLWVSGRGGGDILTESKLVLFIRLPFYSPSSYPLLQKRTSTYYSLNSISIDLVASAPAIILLFYHHRASLPKGVVRFLSYIIITTTQEVIVS